MEELPIEIQLKNEVASLENRLRCYHEGTHGRSTVKMHVELKKVERIKELLEQRLEAGQVDAVVIGREEMGEMEHFVIMQDGFNGTNEFVQMDLRPLDGKSEGRGLAIAFSTAIMEYKGDYAPITLSKAETKQLIDYLNEIYEAL